MLPVGVVEVCLAFGAIVRDGAPTTGVGRASTWLDLTGPKRLSLITLYFDQPDHAGHEFGPDSPKTAEAAARTDSAIARLVQGLR